jgi:hypothetical protein
MLAPCTFQPLKLVPNMFAPDTLMLLKLGPLGCTLLHCKVHLSMFHSSPTSRIWHTSTLLSVLGTRENNFSVHFKCNYLIIHVVKFCEMFCTCSPSSLGQHPMVESAKKKFKKIHLGLFSKKWQFWGVF